MKKAYATPTRSYSARDEYRRLQRLLREEIELGEGIVEEFAVAWEREERVDGGEEFCEGGEGGQRVVEECSGAGGV